MESGVPVQGICLYPIVNHPGWINQRHCYNGLWDYPDATGHRPMFRPLAREIERWREIFEPAPQPRGPMPPRPVGRALEAV